MFVFRLDKKPIPRPENTAILRVPGRANSYGLRTNLPSIPDSKLYRQSSDAFSQEENFYELDEYDEISYPTTSDDTTVNKLNKQDTDC